MLSTHGQLLDAAALERGMRPQSYLAFLQGVREEELSVALGNDEERVLPDAELPDLLWDLHCRLAVALHVLDVDCLNERC